MARGRQVISSEASVASLRWISVDGMDTSAETWDGTTWKRARDKQTSAPGRTEPPWTTWATRGSLSGWLDGRFAAVGRTWEWEGPPGRAHAAERPARSYEKRWRRWGTSGVFRSAAWGETGVSARHVTWDGATWEAIDPGLGAGPRGEGSRDGAVDDGSSCSALRRERLPTTTWAFKGGQW